MTNKYILATVMLLAAGYVSAQNKLSPTAVTPRFVQSCRSTLLTTLPSLKLLVWKSKMIKTAYCSSTSPWTGLRRWQR